MTRTVILHFPFRLDGYEYKAEIETEIVRKENVVGLKIPLWALVSVNSEKVYTVYYGKVEETGEYTVSIEFKSINDAIAFYKEPSVHLSYREPEELEKIDKKLEEVSHLLEATGSSWRKRRRCTEPDEDGFVEV